MKKTLLFLLLAIVGMVSWAQEFVVGGITYSILEGSDRMVAVTSGAEDYAGDISVPAKVTYNFTEYTVTTIAYPAFNTCQNLTSVTIAEGVKYIEHDTFYGSGITSVSLPSTVESIGMSAFQNCSALTSITIPGKVTAIENATFRGCSSLTSVTVPNGVTSIGRYAFTQCTSLTSVALPSSLTSIDANAFGGCTALKDITCMAFTAPTLQKTSFGQVPSDATLHIPAGSDYSEWTGEGKPLADRSTQTIPVSTIAYTAIAKVVPHDTGAFGDAVFLNSEWEVTGEGTLSFMGDPTAIGTRAFDGCQSLVTIDIPSSVTSIGNAAFTDCSNLVSLAIPASVTSIGEGILANCFNMESLTVAPGNTTYNSLGGLNVIVETATNTLVTGCDVSVIPSSVTSIGNSAFLYSTNLATVVLPEGVTSIGQSAFLGCPALTSITLPASLTSIGQSAFMTCSSLNNIVSRAASAPTTGDNAFYGVANTGTLSTPYGSNYTTWTDTGKPLHDWTVEYATPEDDELTTIAYTATAKVEPFDTDAFGSATYIRSDWNASTGEGCLYFSGEVTEIGYYAFGLCYSLTSITLPASVTEIGYDAFEYCSALTAITIPEGVTKIGLRAFSDCSSLTSITLPASITSIRQQVFNACSALTSITIPEGVTSIEDNAFSKCSSLASITIPASVTSIEYDAFSDCRSLTSLTVADGNTKYDSRGGCNAIIETETNTLIQGCNATVIPESVTNIGDYAFSNCSALTSITIPASVTSIGDGAFNGCEALTSITIPEGVTSIGERTFIYCSALTSITIPASVTSIKDLAFNGCRSLTSITCLAATAPTLDEDAFYGLPDEGTLTFPEGSDYSSWTAALPSGWTVNYINLVQTAIPYTATAQVEPNNTDAFGSATYVRSEWDSSTGEGCLYFSGEVTTIGTNAFNGCEALTAITIPEGVTSIGEKAFYGCEALATITSLAATAPTLGENAFKYLPTEGTLTIPEDSDYSSWIAALPSGWTVKEAVSGVTLTICLTGITELTINLTPGDTYTYKDHPVTGNSVTALKFNGADVLSQFIDGRYITPALTENSVLEVTYSNAGGGLEGDVTGDGKVDVSDVTKVVSIILNAK